MVDSQILKYQRLIAEAKDELTEWHEDLKFAIDHDIEYDLFVEYQQEVAYLNRMIDYYQGCVDVLQCLKKGGE